MKYRINLKNVVSVYLDDNDKNTYYLFIKDSYSYSYNISIRNLNYINQFLAICIPFYIKSKDSIITPEVEEYILNYTKDYDYSIKFGTWYHLEDNILHTINFKEE